MATFRSDHVFNCDPATFWEKVFFDADYNRRLFNEILHFALWKELRTEDKGTSIERVVQASPPIGDLPGALKAIVGDNAGYEEHGVYDKAAQRYTARVKPNRLADKLSIEIKMFTQSLSEKSCRRIVEGKVEAKIFGVGGMLEKKMVSDLERSYEKSAGFTNLFLREKGW